MLENQSSPRIGLQFTLRRLLLAVGVIALSCVALRTPTPFWSGLILVVLVLALLASILIIVYRSGRTRAFAIGFLVFGGGCLVSLALLEGSLGNGQAIHRTPIHNGFDWLFTRLHVRMVAVPSGGMGMGGGFGSEMSGAGGFGGGMSPGGSYPVSEYQATHFKEICTCLLSALVGILGGVIAQMLYETRREESRDRT